MGLSSQTESSWEECLSDAHLEFVLSYFEQVRAREEAARIDAYNVGRTNKYGPSFRMGRTKQR
jgi:hypothetical protein